MHQEELHKCNDGEHESPVLNNASLGCLHRNSCDPQVDFVLRHDRQHGTVPESLVINWSPPSRDALAYWWVIPLFDCKHCRHHEANIASLGVHPTASFAVTFQARHQFMLAFPVPYTNVMVESPSSLSARPSIRDIELSLSF